MKKLSEIYAEEFEFCKEKPRQNFIVIKDRAGLVMLVFYSHSTDEDSSPGLVLQPWNDKHECSPIVYPETNDWTVLYKVEGTKVG